ncbi:LysR family transcriptional regulator [Clostridiaceae bacterium]|nr:LysR family transcriptional regulator [Clostridiaceae bacterium]RKI16883.1 LysR family transcriptional regulator [bacterium 1XD21-70]
MDIKNLETFIQVAELSSFTKAAEKSGYSQSTVSFQIRQLEKSLGLLLFERVNHTVSLTAKGREVLAYAHEVRRLTQELEKQLHKEQEQASGHVRIAMADSLCSWLLRDDFQNFRRCHPKITVKIISGSTEEMFRLLNQNEVDLVYTLDNHIYDRTYRIASEEKVTAHFVAGAGYLAKGLEGTRPLSPRQLAGLPFLLTEKGMSYRRLMDERLAALSLEIRPILETGNADLICQLVAQGMGISFLPDYVTREAVKNGRVCYLPVEGFGIEIWRQLLYHHDKWVSPPMQAVIEYLGSNKRTASVP